MKYFDSLYRSILSEDLLPGNNNTNPLTPPLSNTQPISQPTPQPPSNSTPTTLTPEPTNSSSTSALTTQKKLQLAKLIALALLTPLGDNNSNIIHHIKSSGDKPVVQGNAKEQESMIIKAIAKIQGDKVSSILDQIKYIPADTTDETSTNFISPDEYANLVNLARTALITSPNNIGGAERADLSVYDINTNNIDQKLKDIKNLLSQTL